MSLLYFQNHFSAIANTAIGASDTVLSLTSSQAPITSIPENCLVPLAILDDNNPTNYEVVYCSAISGTNYTVIRGQEGSTPSVWSAGVTVLAPPTAGTQQLFTQAGYTPVWSAATATAIGGYMRGARVEDSSGILWRSSKNNNTTQPGASGAYWTQVDAAQVPIGAVLDYGAATAPAGWLVCSGQAVSRLTYSALFAVIGTTFGAGNGTTTFNIPDFRGRFSAGLDNMGGSAAGRLTSAGSAMAGTILGATGGSELLASHNHGLTDPGHSHGITDTGHSHGISDPGHSHGVNDPEHSHTNNGNSWFVVPQGTTNNKAANFSGGGDKPEGAYPTTASSQTGVTVNSARTGVSVNTARTGVSANSSQTGITISSAGGGGSANVPPAMMVNKIIYAGNAASENSNDSGSGSSSTYSTVASVGIPVNGADSIMVTGFNEFDYDTVVQPDNKGGTFNATLDNLVNGLSVADSQANFKYTIQQDLARLTSIQTAMMWVQWFSTCASDAGEDPAAPVPAINNDIYSTLTSSSQWTAGGVSASDAMKLGGFMGGSPNDDSLIRGMQYLQSRGYEVGFAPIVLGNVDGTTLNSQQLVWRGYFNFSTTTTLQTFLTAYEAFVKYYLDLFGAAGISLSRFAVGSEFQYMTNSAPAAHWALFAQTLQTLADYGRTKFPDCTITYASNYTEYGNPTFRNDSLWTYKNIDQVGIDWYMPLTVGISSAWNDINAGQRSGEGIDFSVTITESDERSVLYSQGKGKTGLPQTALSPNVGIKNALGFYYGNHYTQLQSGNLAEATPMAGFDQDFNPYGLGAMTGTGVVTVASIIGKVATGGVAGAIQEADAWLALDGTKYGVFNTPTYTSTAKQTSYQFDMTWQLTTVTQSQYARLFKIDNVLEVLIDTSAGVKVSLGPDSAQYTVTLGPLDTSMHTMSVSLDIATALLTIVYDGTSSQYTVTASDVVGISSNVAAYVGSYDETNNFAIANIFTVGLTFVQAGITYGGTFHFEEAYAGVRTAWTPKLKPLYATEMGFASTAGTCVEPNNFFYADIGSVAMNTPSLMDDITGTFFESAVAAGWKPSNLYGSYGSSFCYSGLEQYNAWDSSMSMFRSLKTQGAIAGVTVYNLDARPASAMFAQSGGEIYYVDGPMSVFTHALNGKPAGGSTLLDSALAQGKNLFA